MKKILITLAMAILSCCSYAQYLPLTAGSGNPLTGDLHIDGTNGNRVIFSYGGVSNNKVLLGSSYSIFGTGSKDDFATYIKDSHPYSIWTNDLQRLTVDGSGNVGIGTTSPAYKLESDETDAGTNNIAYPLSVNHLTTSTATDGFGSGINFGTQNYTGTHIGAGRINVYHYTTNTTKMTFSTIYGFDNFVDAMTLFNGNVGVGTASPSAKLDIVGGAVSVTNPNPTCVFVDNANSNYSWSIQNTAGAYRFYDNTADAERLRISSNGNIGIGTTSPGSKLDVNGSINMVNGGNLTWGGIYGTGIPTIGANSTAGLVFYPGGSTSGESLRINPSGNVGIGTVDPKGYRLAVAGDAIAESMTVDLQANWPDYVIWMAM